MDGGIAVTLADGAQGPRGWRVARGLLPQEPLQALAAVMFEGCRQFGWLAPAASPAHPLAAPDLAPIEHIDPCFVDLQQRIAVHPAFTALRTCEPVQSLVAAFCGAPVRVGQGDLCRVVAPGQPPTRPHQDGHYTGGATDTCTLWVPLHGAGLDRGGLALDAGAAPAGLYPHEDGDGPEAGLTVAACGSWESPALSLGDAVLFNHHVVHRGVLNPSRCLRFSVEFRFARAAP